MEKISNFVDEMRISNSGHSANNERSRIQSTDGQKKVRGNQQTPVRMDMVTVPDNQGDNSSQADKSTDQLLLQAEKCKARVEAPKGMMISSVVF